MWQYVVRNTKLVTRTSGLREWERLQPSLPAFCRNTGETSWYCSNSDGQQVTHVCVCVVVHLHARVPVCVCWWRVNLYCLPHNYCDKSRMKWVGYVAYIHSFIYSFIHSFIHSFCSLSHDRSIASPKQVLHRVWCSAFSSNFQYPLFSLRLCSSFLCLPRVPVISILPSIFSSMSCFRR
jgi:hypothetical protein